MATQPSQPFRIRSLEPQDRIPVIALAKSLTEFFPHDVIPLIEVSIQKNPSLVGLLEDEIVGFLVYTLRDSRTAEIVWMGIKKDYHGLGLGSMMLGTLEQELARKGIKKLIASTLSYTVPYKPYEKVRTFYYNRGFKSLGIQSDYYHDEMDRLILVKDIR
jgi:ribosomal protein S18 acetylase RimI-like enzyme